MTTDFLRDQEISIIEHPPYSPDLAPADFFLFPQLKKACVIEHETINRCAGRCSRSSAKMASWRRSRSEWVRVVGGGRCYLLCYMHCFFMKLYQLPLFCSCSHNTWPTSPDLALARDFGHCQTPFSSCAAGLGGLLEKHR